MTFRSHVSTKYNIFFELIFSKNNILIYFKNKNSKIIENFLIILLNFI